MPAKKDLTGQKFHHLTVIREIPKEERKNPRNVEWECLCDCGNTTRVITNYLISGHTKSCGCIRKTLPQMKRTVDITGKRFGKLIALEMLDKLGSDKTKVWKCKCDCGNIHYTTLNQLQSGNVQSCGCQRSRGEGIITQILQKNNYNFKQQYHFEDLRSKENNYYLYFDFAVFDNNNNLKCLIEYQGEQHYHDTTRGAWKSPIANDNLKRDYCKNNKIKLIEIPYTDFNLLDENYLMEKIGS